jgi:hypothetical protein
VYTVDQGVRGFSLPRHYDVSKGRKLTIAPQRLAAIAGAAALPRWDWQELAKYSAPVIAVATIAAVLVQSAGDPVRPVTPVTPGQTPIAPAATVMPVDSAVTVSDDGQAAPSVSNSTSGNNSNWNTSSSAWSNGQATAPASNVSGNPSSGSSEGGRGAETTPSLPMIDDVMPIVDPVIDPVAPTTPVTGGTETGTEPEEQDDVEIVTPIVQVGVDVHPPSLNLSLAP